MNYNLLYIIGLGVLLVVLIPLGIVRGIIKPKGAIGGRKSPSAREISVVGLALLFLAILIGFALSPVGSVALIIGLGILLSTVLAIASRRMKSDKHVKF
ncbi:hypothetical protein [Collimonas fungivorans]|uniref:hypothetical protein n=1 Tax=Collimonas fungivorans TaxID=158899 RepID=UPI003FA3D9E2